MVYIYIYTLHIYMYIYIYIYMKHYSQVITISVELGDGDVGARPDTYKPYPAYIYAIHKP